MIISLKVFLFLVLVEFAIVRFCTHSYDYRPNRTPLSLLTSINGPIKFLETVIFMVNKISNKLIADYLTINGLIDEFIHSFIHSFFDWW